jgi:D-alanine--poly(phosphoribitol) ligase subunit 2
MPQVIPSFESILAAVSDLLASVTGVAETQTAPDLKIRELGILDSLGIISLILGLCEKFSVDIAPAEIEEEDVASPRAIAEFVRRKLESATS